MKSPKFILIICLLAKSIVSVAQEKTYSTDVDIARHYVGMVGNKKVVVDYLWGKHGGSNYGGTTCYYVDEHVARKWFIRQNDNEQYYNLLFQGEEYERGADNFEEKRPKIELVFSPHSASGKWHSIDGAETYDINLTEDYTDAYPLEFMSMHDTISKIAAGGYSCLGSAYFTVIKAAGSNSDEDYDFINKNLERFLATTHYKAYRLTELPNAYITYSLKEFKDHYEPREMDTLSTERHIPYMYYSALVVPKYNGNGMLSIEKSIDYTVRGTKNDVESSGTLCLDVRGKKIWYRDDIVDAGSTQLKGEIKKQLKALLEAHAKAWGKEQTAEMPADINVSGNILISGDGLTFIYYSQPLGRNYDEIFTAFIPYEKITGALQPLFKQRMNL